MYVCFYVFRTRAWVPGGLPRGAWAASLGSLGRLPGGGPGPKSVRQSMLSPLGFRIKKYVDFDVDFGSFGDRSWVPLGGHFRSS